MSDVKAKRLAIEIADDSLCFTAMMFKAVKRIDFAIAEHHRVICEKLDQILKGTHPTNRLMLNIPPRHSKTEIAVVNFVALGFAINPQSEFMHLSASDDLATTNVGNIRQIMQTPEYQWIFPNTVLSNSAKGSIETSKGGILYAAPFQGQITGFGCGKLDSKVFAGAMLIDDPMKAQDSHSDTIKKKIAQLWTLTLKSRVNDIRTPVIVTAQRLAEDDFCGHLISKEGTIENGGEWDVVKFPAILDEGTELERALWELRAPLSWLKAYKESDRWTFDTQYMQDPMTQEGLMYENLRFWDIIPADEGSRKRNRTDTADTGQDYLCSVNYIETKHGCYITEVIYTQKPMEYTEVATAEMITREGVEHVRIESNNGGRGFSRNVEKQCIEQGNTDTRIEWFYQSENKASRIFSASASVKNIIYFPAHWRSMGKDMVAFVNHVKAYRRDAKNTHDDAPDVLSGMVEDFQNKGIDGAAEAEYLKRLLKMQGLDIED